MKFFSDFLKFKNTPEKAEGEDALDFSSPEDFLGTEESYFKHILTEENFPGYTIERNVHVNRYDKNAHPACYPISFLFSKDSEPVLAVFLMKTNQYRAMISRGSYKILDENNIPYIRFFKGFDNKKSYVIDRVTSSLK